MWRVRRRDSQHLPKALATLGCALKVAFLLPWRPTAVLVPALGLQPLTLRNTLLFKPPVCGFCYDSRSQYKSVLTYLQCELDCSRRPWPSPWHLSPWLCCSCLPPTGLGPRAPSSPILPAPAPSGRPHSGLLAIQVPTQCHLLTEAFLGDSRSTLHKPMCMRADMHTPHPTPALYPAHFPPGGCFSLPLGYHLLEGRACLLFPAISLHLEWQ